MAFNVIYISIIIIIFVPFVLVFGILPFYLLLSVSLSDPSALFFFVASLLIVRVTIAFPVNLLALIVAVIPEVTQKKVNGKKRLDQISLSL